MGNWVVRLAGIAAVLFALGPLTASLGIVAPLHGFVAFGLGGLLSVIAFVVGLIALARGSGNGLAVLVSGVITGVFVFAALPGRSVPRINDITTDMANPPQFVHAPTLAGNQGRDMQYPGVTFAEQQKQGYPDLAGLHLNVAPDEALRKVEAAAKQLPNSEVTRVDPATHSVEGVTTSRLFRFQDDFVVEVRPDNGGSMVHMRSKSRVGKGDVGANAARIRALFAQLR